MRSTGPFIILVLIFSTLAALAAFLITYKEWSHHYADNREPLKMATEAAIVAFLGLGILTALATILIVRLMPR